MRADRKVWAGLIVLVGAVVVAYSNHFDNSFHFDDGHTIVDNPYIRDLHNVGLFFSDSRTFSTIPENRVYRPLVTASLAVDYAIAGGLKPAYFHASTLAWFILQLAVMVALFSRIFSLARPQSDHWWIAIAAAVLYAVHPAIAETVNYIIQRGDIYSTLGVLAALTTYAVFPASRTSGWYLVPLALAILSKPPALIFPALLFAYVRLFEETSTRRAIVRCVPALLVTAMAGGLMVAMTPHTFSPTSGSAMAYRITQPLVALRYFQSFFVPTSLTVDTDLTAVDSVFAGGAWLGLVFVMGVVAAAAWCSSRRDWRPTAFGLWWFLLAQVPTAIFPLAEVENDHRMYFPFVGLVLAVCWSVARWSEPIAAARPVWKAAAAVAGIVVVAGAVFATRQRNEVWRTEESLWLDATEKSPKNGRGLMNYGLTQMEKGDYQRALDYFNRAAVYTPDYYSLEINLGVASGALNDTAEAEGHFRRALELRPDSADSHFFYGRWLRQANRLPEAVAQLEQAVALNPDDLSARYLLMQIYEEHGDGVRMRAAADSALQRFPGDATAAAFLARADAAASPQTAEDFLNLSLFHHRARRFLDSIAAAQEALKRRPDFAEAYNNIAAAYEDLQQWDLAIEAARKALAIRPDFELARNNLAWAESQKKLQETKPKPRVR